MTLQSRDNQALRRFTSRVIDYLADVRRPRLMVSRFREILVGIGARVGVEHVDLFIVSTSLKRASTVTLTASSLSEAAGLPAHAFRQVPLSMFSRTIVQSLQQKQPVFLPLTHDGTNGARLLSVFMKQSDTSGLLLCPIHIRHKLAGFIGLAHGFGPHHVAPDGCHQIRLIGQLMVQKVRTVRHLSRQRRHHRQWRHIADSVCDFAILIGPDHRVLQMLPLGTHDLPEISGVLISSLFSERSWRALRRAIAKSQEDRTPVSCDLKVAWSLTQQSWFRVRVHAGHAADQLMLYFTDIDADRQQQEQLRELELILNRTYRLNLLGQVSTEFAHQINQPLQAILNHCGTLQMRMKNHSATPARTAQSIRNIMDSVGHASAILHRIREFVQLKSLSMAPFDVIAIAERAAMMVENRTMDARVKLLCRWRTPAAECSAGHIGSLWASVDEVQTTQILINLIVNAVEACEGQVTPSPQVEICIDTGDDPRYLQICVIDNGPGLPKENPEQVFEKFYTTKPEGLGIGLAVSRSVAEAQNGSLKACNNPDRGCTFCFTVRRISAPSSDTDEIPTIPASELPVD